ncbi:hypothetical protein Mal52_28460 [Symmachiella dynata]|uniref:Uncharacterized protein n=1 Tax=Symmachiella dynata TaxID=2527995 RepID=A0A517ZPF5_9PLAN|nr:hypothetical protein Mal52_28460 [Symmachiella dynata]
MPKPGSPGAPRSGISPVIYDGVGIGSSQTARSLVNEAYFCDGYDMRDPAVNDGANTRESRDKSRKRD